MEAVAEPSTWVRARSAARRCASYFTVGTYTAVAPLGCLAIGGLDLLWRGDEVSRARRMQRLTAGAYRFMHDWLRLVRITDFDHRTALAGVPAGPGVVVANHPTLMDITSITAALGGGFTIVKGALHGRRMLRPIMQGAGHVAAADADPMSARRVVDEAVERVGQGFRAIVFPEGTRSFADGLRPFGRTAFEIACRGRVPVISVSIECRPMYLSKEVTVFHPPDPTPVLSLGLLAVDDPADSGFDSRALLRLVEGRYRRWYEGRRLAAPDATS